MNWISQVEQQRELDAINSSWIGEDSYANALYCFVRHKLIDKRKIGFDGVIASNRLTLILLLVFLPFDLFKLLARAGRSSSIAITSDRLNSDGNCKYIALMSETKNLDCLKLFYSLDKFSGPIGSVRIGGIVILIKAVARVLAVLSNIEWLSVDDRVKNCPAPQLSAEFDLLHRFWRGLIYVSNAKRVFVISGAFYAPLIHVARNYGLRSYEVGHALVFPFHPIYSVCKEHGGAGMADCYIDNEYAPLVNRSFVPHSKVIQTSRRRGLSSGISSGLAKSRLLSVECLTGLNDDCRLLVLGQGGEVDQQLVNTMLMCQSGLRLESDVVFRPHPAFPVSVNGFPLAVSKCIDLEHDLEWCTHVLTVHSMAALNALIMGKKIIILSEWGRQIFMSLSLEMESGDVKEKKIKDFN